MMKQKCLDICGIGFLETVSIKTCKMSAKLPIFLNLSKLLNLE